MHALQRLRKKLLDLTSRNPLLNFRHRKTSLRIVDELPNQVADELHAGRSFVFAPVPLPSEAELQAAGFAEVDSNDAERPSIPPAAEWAAHVGIRTAFELPEGHAGHHHEDDQLQTLLYAEQLEARLRSIRSKAETAINETGANILYLVVGFLEWYESDQSDTSRLAPLYTIPVRLERDRLDASEGVFRYKITFKDEDVVDNITLREKLANDFGLALPEIENAKEPEDFFQSVADTILRQKPRWKIHRYITLATLNFRKQSMYHDLDPDRWPDSSPLLGHRIVRHFFESSPDDSTDEETGESGLRPEYDIDEIEDVHTTYPLIFDADSSQHSALKDAIDRRDLVIEGPPGTGKSQTITNLIAASIATGRTVLFVAEKMAALNVVKRRLDRAGLGHFCLELHSHLTDKVRVLGSLEARIHAAFRHPASFETEISVLEGLQADLSTHAKQVNQKWKSTGMTAHEILTGAVRYRRKLGISPRELRIDWVDGDSYTPYAATELAENARRLAIVHRKTEEQARDGKIENHFWYGVSKPDLNQMDIDALHDSLSSWTKALRQLQACLNDAKAQLGVDLAGASDLDEVAGLAKALSSLPEVLAGDRLAEVEQLRPHAEMSAGVQEYRALHSELERLTQHLTPDAFCEAGSATLASFNRHSSQLGCDVHARIEDLALLSDRLTQLQQGAASIEAGLAEMREHAPSDLLPCFAPTLSGLNHFGELVETIQGLPSGLWAHRTDTLDDPDLDQPLELLAAELKEPCELHQQLQPVFKLSNLPRSEELRAHEVVLRDGGLLRWLRPQWRRSRSFIRTLLASEGTDVRMALDKVPDLVRYAAALESVEKLVAENPVLRGFYSGVETPTERVLELRAWYRNTRQRYGRGFDSRAKLGSAILSLDRDIAIGISTYSGSQFTDQVREFLEALERVRREVPGYESLASVDEELLGTAGSLSTLNLELRTQLEAVGRLLHTSSASCDELRDLADALDAALSRRSEWISSPAHALLSRLDSSLSVAPGEYSEALFQEAFRLLAVGQQLDTLPRAMEALRASPTVDRYEELRVIGRQLEHHCHACSQSETKFVDGGDVQPSDWLRGEPATVPILIERNESALAQPEWLNTWAGYVAVKEELIPKGLSDIIAELEARGIPNDSLEDVVRCVAYHQLAEQILSEDPKLGSFHGISQDSIRERFRERDREMLELQRQRTAALAAQRDIPQGSRGGRVADLTELTLIEHEIGKKKRHIPLRALASRCASALPALKPCFMMSPMSVARYLEPGVHMFDLVIMDEASQIRPEDALGAIARGRNLIVVGDPKQLPPTNFFDALVDEDEKDEEAVTLQESGSILDVVAPMFPNRRLRWHYRSRHESLIEFSNRSFYNSDLVIFPSPFQESEGYGIRLHRVADGCFVERKNTEEALAVVDFVVDQLTSSPSESVGVVCMNVAQRECLEQFFEKRLKENAQLRDLLQDQKGAKEPLFFKNLENVQGDERDVIVISMTYGPTHPGSAVPQRFGPINQSEGWRRLNVLFTRSKKRMHVFTSMRSSDVLLDRSPSRGKQALRQFLEFAEGNAKTLGTVTGKEPDSDFEIAVQRALKDHGYECEPQLGVAGYYLDLAVRDPRSPGHFLLGIECDGASYHSAKSARDRDRLRQEVLEGLGWRIRRIWSTDWFKNPDAQLAPILRELETLTS